ncbi:hypothetical protein ACFSO9_00020 [Mesonia maritima]|uniref:hypothetical protein n=1 Tax=Mesonia maritima TaxID=1793873 RepID=UPI00362F15B5
MARDILRLHSIYREKVIQDLQKEIELGWNGSNSSMTIDQIIESKKNLNEPLSRKFWSSGTNAPSFSKRILRAVSCSSAFFQFCSILPVSF